MLAALLSLFIYLHYFGLENQLFLQVITTFSALLAFFMLLESRRITLFWTGAFTALLWFYWVPFSFLYYDLTYIIPLLTLFFSFIYGLIFWFVGLFSPIVRVLAILSLSFIHPLNYNWFVPEMAFIDSFFGIEKWQFGLILTALALFIMIKHPLRYLSLLIMIGA